MPLSFRIYLKLVNLMKRTKSAKYVHLGCYRFGIRARFFDFPNGIRSMEFMGGWEGLLVGNIAYYYRLVILEVHVAYFLYGAYLYFPY